MVFEMIHEIVAVAEKKPRKRAKRPPKHPYRVVLVVHPEVEISRAQERLEDEGGSPQIGIYVETIHDPLPEDRSAFQWEVSGCGSDCALGCQDDPIGWMRRNQLEFFQKFAIEYTYSSWYDAYNGDYDSEFDYKVVWRDIKGLPAARQEMAMWCQRTLLMAVLEARTTEQELEKEEKRRMDIREARRVGQDWLNNGFRLARGAVVFTGDDDDETDIIIAEDADGQFFLADRHDWVRPPLIPDPKSPHNWALVWEQNKQDLEGFEFILGRIACNPDHVTSYLQYARESRARGRRAKG